jgi:4-amino-4-deoxy-L-arabinose transferase-like glycosyltransferase
MGAATEGAGRASLTGRRPSPELLALAAIVVLGAAIRFATLDLQSFRHDEAVTAARILHPSLFATLGEVPGSESNPPLYYAIAWLWSRLLGTGEVGLRSLSALCGVATIPIVYLIAKRALSTRAGVIAAAIIATNPILVWYSQDARNYSLLVLLCAASLLCMLGALEQPTRRRLAAWAVVSALALATHYFAAFLIAGEAAILLRRGSDRRRAVAAVAAVATIGLALVPLALSQADSRNNFIGHTPLLGRVAGLGVKFLAGEGRGAGGGTVDGLYAAVPAMLVLAAVVALLMIPAARGAAGMRLLAILAATAFLLPVCLALAGTDYVDARNLLPALLPLALLVGAGFDAPRAGAGRLLGTALALGLCAYSIAFVVYFDSHPRLQREDWRSVARAIGPTDAPRLILAPGYGNAGLSYYLGARPLGATPSAAVREVVIVGWTSPSPAAVRRLSPALRPTEQRPVSYDFSLTRLRSPRPLRVSARARTALGLVAGNRRAVAFEQPAAAPAR